MRTTRSVISFLSSLLLATAISAQETRPDNPYPLILHFLGRSRAFSATIVSAVQASDGMMMEGLSGNYAYSEGRVRVETAFSEQWSPLYVLGQVDSVALKRAGVDKMIELVLPEQRKQYMIFPGVKGYCEAPLPQGVRAPTVGDLTVERKADGTEVVDGHRCARSKLVIREKKPAGVAGEERIEAVLWEAQDLNGFPVKLQATMDTPFGVFKSTTVFTNVKLAPPNQSMFALPLGYKSYRSMEELSAALQKLMAADQQSSQGFWAAVEKGDVAQLESLWKKSPEWLNSRGPDDQTVLHIAARSGNVEVVRWCISKRTDVAARDRYHRTPLHAAAAGKNKAVVAMLLAARSEIEALDDGKRTPLAHAAASGDKDVVQTLLAAHANPNAIESRGQTVLWVALETRHAEAAELLVKAGADIHVKRPDGVTPLQWAVQLGDASLIDIIASKKPTINLHDEFGRNLIFMAAKRGCPSLVRYLVEMGVDVNVQEQGGADRTLHIAAREGQLEVVKTLLVLGADHTPPNGWGDNALHVACKAKQKQVAELLIIGHPDLEACASDNRTALDYAASNGWQDTVELLLAQGAPACAQAPASMAEKAEHKELAMLLREHEKQCNRAAVDKAFEVLLSRDLTPEEVASIPTNLLKVRWKYAGGRSLLHMAAEKNRKNSVELLLARGVSTELRTAIPNGYTPLVWAVAKDYTNIVELLLTHGAKPRPIFGDSRGRTILDLSKSSTVREMLINHGATNAPVRKVVHR